MKKVKLDLSVFKGNFDPHKRGKQCIRTVEHIKANSTKKGKRLSKANKKMILEYAGSIITKIKRMELSISSFEKYLAEAYNLGLYFGSKKLEAITKEDLNEWWETVLKRYEDGEIAFGTLKKLRECAIIFFKWQKSIEMGQFFKLTSGLKLPKKPKAKLTEEKPNQADIKRLIENVYLEGKRYTIRDRAIISLANDSGARIGEILSMRNKHVRAEKNYLVVAFPESKSMPRRVISILAKPHLEAWAKVSPNKDKDGEAFFFCKADGSYCTYPAIAKSLKRALKKTSIPWKKRKALHYFRTLFTSRAFNWSYALKHYWLGWALKDMERSYTELDYGQCIEQYSKMLQDEQNPMLKEENAFWEKENMEEKVIEKLLEEKPEFRFLLRQLIRETSNGH